MEEFKISDLGLIDFKKAWDAQKSTHLAVRNGKSPSTLILCQHYPVITLGRHADKNSILTSVSDLNTKGIQLYKVERGGDVTYHGPGLINAYPIFDLNHLKKDIHWFLRKLEEVVILLLRDYGITAFRRQGLTGVWVHNAGENIKFKIASMGIAVTQWVTMHGLSIIIKKEGLDNFRLIRPCGMDVEVISLETLLCRTIEMEEIKKSLIYKFEEAFLTVNAGAFLL